MKNLLKNWKTSAAGILGFVMTAGPQIQACLVGQPCNWKQIGLGIALGALGIGAKDHDVTGGNR